jgi:putative PIN family toxin of toxin-antitoxin system
VTVVIDCNVLVMCLTMHSPYHVIYQSLIAGKFNVAVSVEIMLEYEEVIQRKYSIVTAHALIALLTELNNVHYTHPHYHWQLIKADADDNKYCDCAIAGQAAFIVTEDRHFDVLKKVPFPALTAITIDRFLEILQSP